MEGRRKGKFGKIKTLRWKCKMRLVVKVEFLEDMLESVLKRRYYRILLKNLLSIRLDFFF